jgi:hypothetical protein
MSFSKANNKLQAMVDHPDLQPYLENKRKVYSFDLLSGHSCPFAEQCLSKVKIVDGKRKVVDGKKTEFRCFSASQEATYTNTYNSRKRNFDNLRGKSAGEMVSILRDQMPKNLGICRIHVAGDFFSPAYFEAWIRTAIMNPDRLFYAYTKSLPYWVDNLDIIPDNLILTASYGGRRDDMIVDYDLRSAKVVFSYEEADMLGLEVDHDDTHAANPFWGNDDFALIIHGIQPKGSEAADAIKQLKKEGKRFSYGKAQTA